ncbi:MAG: futalosine hydrolase [Planctomycetota bacterium]
MPNIEASQTGVLLVAVAAPKEVSAIRDGLSESELPVEILETGVGKSAAASAVATRLAVSRHGGPAVLGVLNAGIGGAIPPWGVESLGRAVVAESSVFGDEGVLTSKGFQPIESLGFGSLGPANAVVPPRGLLARVRPLLDDACVVATVSSCSGTDGAASEIARRSGARVEAMEGAAAGLAAQRAGVAFLELRVISNTTGDRDRQVWRLEAAFKRLREVTTEVARAWLSAQM